MRSIFRRKAKPDIFERLEQEASNELQLLEELGPQGFGTEHLMELHAQICANINEQQRLTKVAMSIGATGIGWLLLGFLAFFLGYQTPGLIAFGLSAVCFMIFFGAITYSFRRFRTKGHLEYTRLSIEDELRNRRDKQRKHMEDW